MDDDFTLVWIVQLALWLLASMYVLGLAALLLYGLYCALSDARRPILAMSARAVVEIVVVVVVVGVIILVFADA
jgi:hypothetical protein